jgi:hypothetical protein
VARLNVYGGSGGNTFYVNDTSPFLAYTTLDSGQGGDTVNFRGSTGTLWIDGDAGTDFVNVGLAGKLDGIKGDIHVINTNGVSYLYVHDSANPTAKDATLSTESISGLAPANIDFAPTTAAFGGVSFLDIFGGSGGNTFTINSADQFALPVHLNSGAGNDQVNVQAIASPLIIDGATGPTR